jgi:prepilin-type N-terminal cleavage/methylation domain-containing protein
MRIRAHTLDKNSAGFTLIELVVVFSIMAVLGTVGIASFVSYSRSQSLQQATNDLLTTLNTAKADAVSQIKPADCQNKTLNGYQVVLLNTTSYQLQAICNGSLETTPPSPTPLPTGVSFSSITPMTIRFDVLTGGVTGYGQITIIGASGTSPKTITVTAGGVIQ